MVLEASSLQIQGLYLLRVLVSLEAGDVGSRKAGITGGCESAGMMLGTNLGLLQEQEELLTAEPSSQPLLSRVLFVVVVFVCFNLSYLV